MKHLLLILALLITAPVITCTAQKQSLNFTHSVYGTQMQAYNVLNTTGGYKYEKPSMSISKGHIAPERLQLATDDMLIVVKLTGIIEDKPGSKTYSGTWAATGVYTEVMLSNDLSSLAIYYNVEEAPKGYFKYCAQFYTQ